MKIYQVGGSIRDELLGLSATDRDWLVIGATHKQMLDLGYLSVGRSFPVFLHPETKEEYALARMERKQSVGHKGFKFITSPEITVEQDLLRRDLTINAIARDQNGKIIDPYGGVADIKRRVLRHVSTAFSEDPLRVFRVARFAACLHHYGFVVADETLHLMRKVVNSGELETLSAERIWNETRKALLGAHPSSFFIQLRACNALRPFFSELEELFLVANTEFETNEGALSLAAVDCARDSQTAVSLEVSVASLGHNVSLIGEPKTFAHRFKPPRRCIQLLCLVNKYWVLLDDLPNQNPHEVLKMFQATRIAFNRKNFEQLTAACVAISRARGGMLKVTAKGMSMESQPVQSYPHIALLNELCLALRSLPIPETFNNRKDLNKLNELKLATLEGVLNQAKLTEQTERPARLSNVPSDEN